MNTCSFIDSSKEESIGHILEIHQQRGLRKRRSEQKLIVAGCMSQRFAKDLPGSMPEVDAFIGLDQVTRIVPIIDEIYSRERGKGGPPASFVTPRSTFIPDYNTPRFRLTPRHFAYVKIAEGCNHPCTFCIIPQIRGRHRSRTVESVVAEARQLVAEGVKEINLISQDTTFFGMDTWDERPNPRTPVDSSRGTALTSLLRGLDAIEGDFWIRILYTHPAHWSDELIRTIAECPKVARYVDMPLQHISDRMLAAMQRETGGDYIRDLVRRIRAGIPGNRAADDLHRRLPRRDGGRRRRALRLRPRGQLRAARRVSLLAGGGNAGRQDAGAGARQGQGAPLAPGHGASRRRSPAR